MDRFEYRDGELWCEDVRVREAADRFGTPLYLYSQDTLLTHYDRFRAAFAALDPLICFSVKCCQNTHICRLLAERGSGFDVVSGGELFRALRAGADPQKIVYAGVGKTEPEIREALAADIGWFNIESESELEQMATIAAAAGRSPRVALRVNPDVDAQTHAYTTTGKKETKFGVDIDAAGAVFQRWGRSKHVRLTGLHLHIGSPVNHVSAYEASMQRAIEFIDARRGEGLAIDTLDIGGGYGAHYAGSEAPSAAAYAAAIVPLLEGRQLRVILEPGRSIAGNAGLLVTRVLHVKQSGAKRFVIADAAMTELIRPALYGAYHFVWPVAAGARVPATRAAEQPFDGLEKCDLVGPVCESGDFLARDRALPPVKRGDLLAIFTSGAYAMTMASQYNSRPRAPEVLVSNGQTRLIRRRETYADLVAAEQVEG
ncbi:MAG: diaminopimelate decarboxylase [Phycisphaerae bacterium]